MFCCFPTSSTDLRLPRISPNSDLLTSDRKQPAQRREKTRKSKRGWLLPTRPTSRPRTVPPRAPHRRQQRRGPRDQAYQTTRVVSRRPYTVLAGGSGRELKVAGGKRIVKEERERPQQCFVWAREELTSAQRRARGRRRPQGTCWACSGSTGRSRGRNRKARA